MFDMEKAREYHEIMDLLAGGGPDDWDMLAGVIDGFPDGHDEFHGRRWILNALDCGSVACVRWLLARGVELSFHDAEGRTVVEACLWRDWPEKYEVLRALIAGGANLDDRGTNGWTALHFAVAHDDLAAVRILLDAGADLEARTRIDFYSTPLEDAESRGKHEAAAMIRARMEKT